MFYWIWTIFCTNEVDSRLVYHLIFFFTRLDLWFVMNSKKMRDRAREREKKVEKRYVQDAGNKINLIANQIRLHTYAHNKILLICKISRNSISDKEKNQPNSWQTRFSSTGILNKLVLSTRKQYALIFKKWYIHANKCAANATTSFAAWPFL